MSSVSAKLISNTINKSYRSDQLIYRGASGFALFMIERISV